MTIIREAYETIKDPSRWTRGASARDKYGDAVMVHNPGAVKFCATGALDYRSWLHGTFDRTDAEIEKDQELIGQLCDMSYDLFETDIVSVNDRLGHEAIVQLYEKALIELEGSL